MKILMVGNYSGWMGLHLNHLTRGFQRAGAEVLPADYHVLAQPQFWCAPRLLPLPLSRRLQEQNRNRNLERLIRRSAPDLVLFAGSWKFDLKLLKANTRARLVIWDFDGPRRSSAAAIGSTGADLCLTVSRPIERELAAAGIPVLYLPHGVDSDYYAPQRFTQQELAPFAAPLSYIGRATPRRTAIAETLAPFGLRLYGGRWTKCGSPLAAGCCSRRGDVAGDDVVKIYAASTLMINVLQEPLDQFKTILSLQCFAVPATGVALAAERVEEAAEAFEPDREILLWDTAEELHELVRAALADPARTARIGEAARRRVLAEHTHAHRAAALLRYLS